MALVRLHNCKLVLRVHTRKAVNQVNLAEGAGAGGGSERLQKKAAWTATAARLLY